MEPAIAWVHKEQRGQAYDLWTRVWEISESLNGNTADSMHGKDQKPMDFIPLNGATDQKLTPAQLSLLIHQTNAQKRRKENRASTYGLNHSSNKHLLEEDGGLTPWKPKGKIYELGTQG